MKEPLIQLPPGYMDLLQRKRYSTNTIKIYCSYFLDFIRYFDQKDINAITYNQIYDYLTQLIQHRNISASQQNQRINAIKPTTRKY